MDRTHLRELLRRYQINAPTVTDRGPLPSPR
jgi:hypothetical protein